MEQQQISAKKLKAMEKVKRANAELAKVVREEKEQLRKAQDRHKYMMGGCVVKYFPEAYDFSEQEMNRIIACAFSLKDVKNMIATVLKERPDPAVNNDEEEENVHCEVLLPEKAPEEYKDPYVLWNSVELVEKSKDAQLARTFRIELPNE